MKIVIPPYIDAEVKYKKVDASHLVPRPEIQLKTSDGKDVVQVRLVADRHFEKDGQRLQATIGIYSPEGQALHEGNITELPKEILEILDRYSYLYITVEGKSVSSKDIRYHAVMRDGQMQEVSPFEMTKEIVIPPENWVPAASLGAFLVESTYELFSTDEKTVRKLYETAEKIWEKDVIGITTFSWGRGFIQYYGLVEPIMYEGKFVWRMRLAQAKEEYSYMMDIPPKVVAVKKPPPLKTLPPVQELIVAARR